MLKKLRNQLRRKLNMNEALKISSQPIWWVYYKMEDGSESVIQIQEEKRKVAIQKAQQILTWKLDKPFEIVSIACI